MNQFITQLTIGTLLAFALLTTAQAYPDTVGTYDENDLNTRTIGAVLTNYIPGYFDLVANIATAWDANEGGVIDEFSPGDRNASFFGETFISGYGQTGVYDVVNMIATGPTIKLDVPNHDWDLLKSGSAISKDYCMTIGFSSHNEQITMATSSGAKITLLAFTVLSDTFGDTTAVAHFSGGTYYSEEFNASVLGNAFFGAVAPEGEYIDYFTVYSPNLSPILIDDLAFRTTTPVPETSCIGLAFAGLALAARRRRSA
jgi:hypothetical protein